jgi:transcriptional regulator with XRE-family HTH domain
MTRGPGRARPEDLTVAALRKRRGWTQQQLADRAGISREQTSRCEHGLRSPASLAALAKALGVGPDALTQPPPDRLALLALAFSIDSDELRAGTSDRARSLRSTLAQALQQLEALDG